MKNRRGATTEYILILTLILGVGMIILWNTLGPAIAEKIQSMGFDYQWKTKKLSKTSDGDSGSTEGQSGSGSPGGLFSNNGGGSTGSSGEISYGSTAVDSTASVTSN